MADVRSGGKDTTIVDEDGNTVVVIAGGRLLAATTQKPMSSYVAEQNSGHGAVVAVNVTAPTRIRILRLDGGSKPSNTADTTCTVTIALGATNIFVKELQVGEPIGGQVCIEGAAGEDLTVTVTGTGSVQFNLRYETFT